MSITTFALPSLSFSDFETEILPDLELIIADPNSKIYTTDECGILLRHLASVDYRKVTIFHAGPKPKQNPGVWKTRGGFRNGVEAKERMLELAGE